jgi:hypothetical protein
LEIGRILTSQDWQSILTRQKPRLLNVFKGLFDIVKIDDQSVLVKQVDKRKRLCYTRLRWGECALWGRTPPAGGVEMSSYMVLVQTSYGMVQVTASSEEELKSKAEIVGSRNIDAEMREAERRILPADYKNPRYLANLAARHGR